MRNCLPFLLAMIIVYGCSELSGKETPPYQKPAGDEQGNIATTLQESLRVRRAEARQMRGRSGQGEAVVKIAISDLQQLAATAAPTDSFVFYFVKYDVNSKTEKARYLQKVRNANWNIVGKNTPSLLVGVLSGAPTTKNLAGVPWYRSVEAFDLAVVCPPPPNCDCEITDN